MRRVEAPGVVKIGGNYFAKPLKKGGLHRGPFRCAEDAFNYRRGEMQKDKLPRGIKRLRSGTYSVVAPKGSIDFRVFKTLEEAKAHLGALKAAQPKTKRTLPRGVYIDREGKLRARINIEGKTHRSPDFDKEEQAADWYEWMKEEREKMKQESKARRSFKRVSEF